MLIELDTLRIHIITTPRNNSVTVIYDEGIRVESDKHTSQHHNKAEALKILRSLISPVEVGDIVFTEYGEGIVTSINYEYAFVDVDNKIICCDKDELQHNKGAYIHAAIKKLEAEKLTHETAIIEINNHIKRIYNGKEK